MPFSNKEEYSTIKKGRVPSKRFMVQPFRFASDCGMYIPLSDNKHQMVRDSSKKRTGQRGRNSNPVATLPHATVVFRMQPFN